MNKIRNGAFTLIVACFLFGCLAMGGAEAAGFPLPRELASEEASYLSGGQAESHLGDNLTPSAFTAGQLQQSVEAGVERHLPAHAEVLLANSAIQRRIIEVANVPFGYDCYPAYFGSDNVYLPANDALAALPGKASDEYEQLVASFIAGMNESARENPSIRFVAFIPQISNTAQVNPASGLMSQPETTTRALASAEPEIETAPKNSLVLTREFASADAYYDEFFKTDHHWNALGTIESYNLIADALGLTPFEYRNWKGFGDYRYTGAYGRSGLMAIDEQVFDTAHSFDSLSILKPDGEIRPFNHDGFIDASELKQKYTFYDSYLSVGEDGDCFINPDGRHTALLVSDSFGGSIGYYLAEQYGNVHLSRQLHADGNISHVTQETRLSNLIAQIEPDDVIFVGHLSNLAHLMEICPEYFS